MQSRNTPEEESAFVDRLIAILTREKYALAHDELRRYLKDEAFTGRWFEYFADDAHPNEITANDLLAVQMLGVTIPPEVSIWVLGDGSSTITALLEQVPDHIDIWEATDQHFAALEELWEVLDTACWPSPTQGNGMGATKKSKLIAAKRPRVAPVLDQVVRDALGPVTNYWDAFRRAFSEPEYRLIESIAATGVHDVSLLRAVDIVVWMSQQHPSQAGRKYMNLDAAISYLNAGREPLPAADVATIKSVMETFGATEFEGRQNGMFFTDVDDRVHVHRTMIVTAEPAPNSTRTDTYEKWPHRIELSGWADRTHGSNDTVIVEYCQQCFNPLDEEHDGGCY